MGYQPRSPHRHRKGKPCQECIEDLERELGMRPPRRPPPRDLQPTLPDPGRREHI